MKICNDCRDPFPNAPEYFYRNKSKGDGLDTICIPCRRKRNVVKEEIRAKKRFTVHEQCQTCTKRKKSDNTCMALNYPIKDCWAYSDDEDWLRKVREQVDKYTIQKEARDAYK